MFFDSHCHLQDPRIANSTPAILARARLANVDKMLCCATQESDWDAVIALKTTHPQILGTLGLHPFFLQNRSFEWLAKLSAILDTQPDIALGETGIDHTLNKDTFIEQKTVFEQHLILAKDFNRPLSIHCRKAWESLVDSIQTVGLPPAGGVIHAYSGSPDMVPVLEKLGLYISFGGTVTYPSHSKAQKSVTVVSLDRLIIETDAPDMLPEGMSQEYNEPALLPGIAKTIASLRDVTVLEIEQQTYENSVKLFSIGCGCAPYT